MNYFDQNPNPPEEDFKDQPEEVTGEEAPPIEIATPAVARPVRPSRPQTRATQVEEEGEYGEEAEAEEEVETTQVLSDARLRLEMGRLYELIMNHDMFEGVDSDPKAIKSVQKEIKAYAQERMEIMLGMRQEASREQPGFPMESFPFNSLEVETLRALAAAATKGASRDAEPFAAEERAPARTSLNPISKGSKTKPSVPRPAPKASLPASPKQPLDRKRDTAIQRILDEEGVTLEEINQVFDPKRKYLSTQEFNELSSEEIIAKNKRIALQRASSPGATPMPTAEQIEGMYTARANAAAAHPQMQTIMGLLDKVQRK